MSALELEVATWRRTVRELQFHATTISLRGPRRCGETTKLISGPSAARAARCWPATAVDGTARRHFLDARARTNRPNVSVETGAARRLEASLFSWSRCNPISIFAVNSATYISKHFVWCFLMIVLAHSLTARFFGYAMCGKGQLSAT